ncbi:MAG TPA: response regulator [Acidobacteriaceae bacterium]|jgi:DNA-binding response OmpR family regulator|nr:response regulator [Acidobacteriaceae bacterium]
MPDSQAAVLIVEDDSALRQLLTAILTQLGFSVRSAEDGFSALSEMRGEIPDVILSDLYMPGMGGFEFLSVVRRRFPTVRAVAMSSAFSGGDVPPGISADAYYEKATNFNTLLEIVKGMIRVERPAAFQESSTASPIWLTKAGLALSGEEYVVIACPQCLRTFPQVFGETAILSHETGCIHCSSEIHYAIVDTLDPTPLRAV